MRKFIRDLITGPDGATYDAVRVGLVLAMLAYIAAGLDTVFVNKVALDFSAFGTGFGILTAGAGAAIAAKQMAGAEPKAADQ